MTAPEKSGWWSRATGYFAPNMGAYDTPEMKEFLAKNPDAKIAVDQLAFAKPWFATYKTVAVRKAIEDELQAVLSGKKQPKEALVAAQKTADEILRPYVEQTALKLPPRTEPPLHRAERGGPRPPRSRFLRPDSSCIAIRVSTPCSSPRSPTCTFARAGMPAYRVSETNMMTERAIDARRGVAAAPRRRADHRRHDRLRARRGIRAAARRCSDACRCRSTWCPAIMTAATI